MSTTADTPQDGVRTARSSPFDAADESPLRRFLDRMIGRGFALVVVRGERPRGLEELDDWLQGEGDRLHATVHRVNLGRFTFNNPWLELDHTIGKVAGEDRTILLLHGIDSRSEVTSRDQEVRLFRQLNVQRDSLARDFPCFWVLYLPTRLEYQLKSQAPDLCDFVGYWATILPGEPTGTIQHQPTESRTGPSYSPFGSYEQLLATFGSQEIVEIVKLLGDWMIENARDRIAKFELSPLRSAHPGALEFARGYLQFLEGDRSEADRTFQAAQAQVDARAHPALLGEVYSAWGDVREALGDFDGALDLYRKAVECYVASGNQRDRAIAIGKIAYILQARGQLDEALRIRREEELPVYEQLGDVRAKAVAMGEIADVLQERGRFEEALRIRRDEQIPVYESLGDVRSKAIAMGKIADALQARGQYDEALRIHREIELPVYERMGEARAKAVVMGKIADILQLRGQLDEALRIRRQSELPVFERIGDVRELILVRCKIGSILATRSDPAEQAEGREHLRWALAEAEKRQYAFTPQLRADVQRLLGDQRT